MPDALAAVAKLLVHIAGQAYLETAIAGAGQEIQEEDGGKRSLPVAARKLSDDEKKSVPFVAARIVEELAATEAQLKLVKNKQTPWPTIKGATGSTRGSRNSICKERRRNYAIPTTTLHT